MNITGAPASQNDLCRNRSSSFGLYSSLCLCAGHFDTNIPQAAKDVRAGQEALVDIFEHIESFFRRLEIYTSFPPTEEMADITTRILAEVLCVLAIATKDINQGRMSKFFL